MCFWRLGLLCWCATCALGSTGEGSGRCPIRWRRACRRGGDDRERERGGRGARAGPAVDAALPLLPHHRRPRSAPAPPRLSFAHVTLVHDAPSRLPSPACWGCCSLASLQAALLRGLFCIRLLIRASMMGAAGRSVSIRDSTSHLAKVGTILDVAANPFCSKDRGLKLLLARCRRGAGRRAEERAGAGLRHQ